MAEPPVLEECCVTDADDIETMTSQKSVYNENCTLSGVWLSQRMTHLYTDHPQLQRRVYGFPDTRKNFIQMHCRNFISGSGQSPIKFEFYSIFIFNLISPIIELYFCYQKFHYIFTLQVYQKNSCQLLLFL